LKGAWERPISIYYIGFTYVNQVRGWLPDAIGGVCWIGFDTPYNTCFMPFYAGVQALPRCMEYGSAQRYDEGFIFWPFNIASNWISLFQNIALPDLISKQKEIEQNEFSLQKEIDVRALALYRNDPEETQQMLTGFCSDNAFDVMNKWWHFTHFLMEKFNSGFINQPKPSVKMGYPEKWRDRADYKKGPISYRKNG
jgi:dipeptidase